jgi:Uma2 family endonuclease
MSTTAQPTRPQARTLEDLLHGLGDVPPARISMLAPPGSGTEEQCLAALERNDGLFELIDGTLVEKTMGFFESRIGFLLARLLDEFAERHGLGIVLGESALMRISGQLRMPDAAFFSTARIPAQGFSRKVVPFGPDLSVEVLSESNTAAEMERKRRECFAGGTVLVWEVEPELRIVRVFTGPDAFHVVPEDGTLEGEPVLPGFRLPLRDLFARVGRFESPS